MMLAAGAMPVAREWTHPGVSLMKRIVAVLALAATLLGCSSEPEVQRVDLGASPEKAMLAALTKVKATDAQKVAVLNAYDSRNGELVTLDKSAKQIIKQWNKLDRTAPDYPQQIRSEEHTSETPVTP